jgi:hypothetical protein
MPAASCFAMIKTQAGTTSTGYVHKFRASESLAYVNKHVAPLKSKETKYPIPRLQRCNKLILSLASLAANASFPTVNFSLLSLGTADDVHTADRMQVLLTPLLF